MPDPRILAIDLRSQLFGFAILEGSATLLDFGRRFFCTSGHRSGTRIARKKIVALLDLFVPSVIVLKRTSGRSDRKLAANRGICGAIKREAEFRSLDLVLHNRRDICQAFRQFGNTSKDDIAAFIAGSFPEVEWKLPPRRKNWHPEHHAMTVFDAISIGLTYFARRGEVFPINRQREKEILRRTGTSSPAPAHVQPK